ncbi:MAG TPA: ATP-binding cassette domain-containing protein, partial [Actinomycetota bacterium]|nr:ATP-binding cassette domain-containing protein [Actinomycetota bacterium]
MPSPTVGARMAPPAAHPMLAAHRVHKRFGHKIVLEDAALEVAAGEAVALVGENGAGKTTLLQV